MAKIEVEEFNTIDPIAIFERRGSLCGQRKDNGSPETDYLEPFGSYDDVYRKYWVEQWRI